MKLIELQEALQAYMLSADLNAEVFLSPDPSGLKERLDIYREGYYWRLKAALSSDYVALERYLGDELFDKLIRSYFAHSPSSFFSLHWVGADLSKFIQAHYPKEIIWVELAEFEWTLNTVLLAKNVEPLSLGELRLVAPEQWPVLIFKLHPAVEIVQFTYNIPEFWLSLMNADNAPPVCMKLPEAQSYLIWRKERQSYFCLVSADEQRMLSLMQQKQDFATLCEKLSESIPGEDVINWVSGILQRWIVDELLVI